MVTLKKKINLLDLKFNDMDFNELLLKTAFCCMACDGAIANEELQLVKHFVQISKLFDDLDIENKLNEYVAEINSQGKVFLNTYIKNVSEAKLDEQKELDLAKIAIKMIEADNKIEYSEISFFKRIRNKLNVSDEKLLEIFKDETLFKKFPDVRPDDFLQPDIYVPEEEWLDVRFEEIELDFDIKH